MQIILDWQVSAYTTRYFSTKRARSLRLDASRSSRKITCTDETMPRHNDSNFLTPSPPLVGVVVDVVVTDAIVSIDVDDGDGVRPSLRTTKIWRLFSRLSRISWAVLDANLDTVESSMVHCSTGVLASLKHCF